MINIVILGGGFSGVRAALDLDWKIRQLADRRKDIRITLIDKNPAQTFYPNLYEVASIYGMDHQHPYHTKLRGTIGIPYEEIFSGTRINVITAEVIEVNLAAQHVLTAGFNLHPFDYLVIALGAVPSTFGVPGADEYAFKFKSVEDGLLLADKIEEFSHGAGNGTKPRIIIGGGGFTGVELATELARRAVITVVEAGPVIMGPIGERERLLIQRRLHDLGITVLVNAPIAEVKPNQVKLQDGAKLSADIIIWSGGVKASAMMRQIAGLMLDDKDRIMVNGSLQTLHHPNVFAVGDNNIFTDQRVGRPVPQVAPVAIAQGKVAAENIARLIGGIKLEEYKPEYSAWVTPVGGKQAVAYVGKRSYSGWTGYLIRQAIDLRYYFSVLPFWQAFKLYLGDIEIFSRND